MAAAFFRNGRPVNISNSTIADNAALGGASASGDDGGEAVGGGVYISNSGTSAVVLNDDTITGNQAIGGTGGAGAAGGLAVGGGVAVDLWQRQLTGAPVTITNSTLSYNIVTRRCRRVRRSRRRCLRRRCRYLYGRIATAERHRLWQLGHRRHRHHGRQCVWRRNRGRYRIDSVPGLSIVNVTVAANVAQAGTPTAGGTAGTGNGGGIDNDSGDPIRWWSRTPWLPRTRRTLAPTFTARPRPPITISSAIYDGTVASGFSATNGDQLGTSGSPINPLLGPLQNNGGNTATAALLAGSPAIDAGDNRRGHGRRLVDRSARHRL